MLKRVMILIILSAILLVLVFMKFHSASPVNTTYDSSKYTVVEYTITKIDGDHYYGKSDDGNAITFSAEKVHSSAKIQVHDKVLLYFDKDDFGNGLVKVEKK